jgi:hypothetical protein
MTTAGELRSALEGRELPGASFRLEHYESAIADHALLAPGADREVPHPLWFIIASLRGMGITVDELCVLAQKTAGDALLFGAVEVTQDQPLRAGADYQTTAQIGRVSRRTTRDGSDLDSIVVTVRLHGDDGHQSGTVTSTYLFKRSSR